MMVSVAITVPRSIDTSAVVEGSSEHGMEVAMMELQSTSNAYLHTMFSDESVHSFDSITATFEDSSSSFLPLLGSESTWNDEAKSEAENMGLNLYDSLVVALRDGADKMDAVFTADHVGTLIEENKRLKRTLVDKSQQIGELQSLVQIKDGRISTLELERDLYKADTTKLSNDVRALLVKVKAIEASSSHDTISTRTHTSSDPSSRAKHNVDENQSPLDAEPASAIGNSSIPSDPGPRPDATGELTPMIAIVPEKSRSMIKPPKERSKHHTGLGGRAIMFCRQMNMKLLANAPSPKMSTTERSDEDSETDSVFSDQLQELRQRLNNAMTTADELRRRLAMVSRYYEGALGKMEQDMFRKLTSLSTDKDNAMTHLQRRVRDLEDELVRSPGVLPRAHIDRTDNLLH
jgi:hypothetical protein